MRAAHAIPRPAFRVAGLQSVVSSLGQLCSNHFAPRNPTRFLRSPGIGDGFGRSQATGRFGGVSRDAQRTGTADAVIHDSINAVLGRLATARHPNEEV
jgi:hypothetical protein